MTYKVLSGGVASAALLDHATSVGDYLGEISLGLLGNLADADLLGDDLGVIVTPASCLPCPVFILRDKSILSFERVLSYPLSRVVGMTDGALSGGTSSAALLDHAASVADYLGEISLRLLGKLSDADLLAEVRALEAVQRQVQVAWHGLIGQLEQRCMPARLAWSIAVLRSRVRLFPLKVRAVSVSGECCRTPSLGLRV